MLVLLVLLVLRVLLVLLFNKECLLIRSFSFSFSFSLSIILFVFVSFFILFLLFFLSSRYSPSSSDKRNSSSPSLMSSLLQLPHFTSREVGESKRGKKFGPSRRDDEMRVYLRGDKLERDGESFKRGQKNFTDEQKVDVLAVEKLLPDLDLNVVYGVDGEDQVVAEGRFFSSFLFLFFSFFF